MDEAQDLNLSQVLMIERSLKPVTGKVVFVGDQNQSIYGFRGVETDAIHTVSERFGAEQLPLHTCWRCPVNVVLAAQTIVPRIKHSPNAEEGVATLRPEEDLIDMLLERDDNLSHAVLCRK